MSHQTPRTPEQNALFRQLKDALNGDGAAVEAVFASSDPPPVQVGTVGVDFHQEGPLLPVGLDDGMWTELAQYQLFSLDSEDYILASEFQVKADSNGPDYAVRLLINGSPVATYAVPVNRTGADMAHTFLRDIGTLSGNVTISLEMFRVGGGPMVMGELKHWSVSLSVEDD